MKNSHVTLQATSTLSRLQTSSSFINSKMAHKSLTTANNLQLLAADPTKYSNASTKLIIT